MIENTSRLSDVVVILTCVYPSSFSTSDDMCVMRTRSSNAIIVFLNTGSDILDDNRVDWHLR